VMEMKINVKAKKKELIDIIEKEIIKKGKI
jgi:hypothetical protein